MATNKQFNVAGCSRHKGQLKMRFAKDIMRSKVLIKDGHTDIDLITLPGPMTKAQAVEYLSSINWDQGDPERKGCMQQVMDLNS